MVLQATPQAARINAHYVFGLPTVCRITSINIHRDGLAAEEITMGEILGDAGYATAFYVSYWPSLSAFVPYPEKKTVSGGMLQEGRARLDPFFGTLMERLTELGIAENTLVILMGDNGPMTHNGPAGMV